MERKRCGVAADAMAAVAAADRVYESGQSAAGARDETAGRDCDAAGAGRDSVAFGPAIVDGERRARAAWRGGGTDRRALGNSKRCSRRFPGRPTSILSLDLSWDARLVAFAVGSRFAARLLFGLGSCHRATRNFALFGDEQRRGDRKTLKPVFELSSDRPAGRFVHGAAGERRIAGADAARVLTGDPGFDSRSVVTAQAAGMAQAKIRGARSLLASNC